MDDYQALVKAYPDAKDYFVEARYVLAGEIAASAGDVVSLETPVEEGTAKAFLSEDYNMMIDQFANFEIMGYRIDLRDHWVEARYVLNAPGASRDGKDILAKGWRDFTAGTMAKLEMSMEELSSPWTGDEYITAFYIDDHLGLDDAIYNLKVSPVTDTDTPNVTLRWPVTNPALEHPQYVFEGDKTSSVLVDAITGEIM